jgi:hypothetical protein
MHCRSYEYEAGRDEMGRDEWRGRWKEARVWKGL